MRLLQGTLISAQEMYIVVVPMLVMGSWFNVECGSSASGRSLRFEVHPLNLPQVLNLREVI